MNPRLAPRSPPLPDLRASYAALERGAPRDAEGEALLLDLDEIVDAANGLAALAGLESLDGDDLARATASPPG